MANKKGTEPKKNVTTFRFDDCTRKCLDLACKITKRNVSNYIEWALMESFKNINLDDSADDDKSKRSIWDIRTKLWAGSDIKSLLFINKYFPQYMEIDDKRILRLIKKFQMTIDGKKIGFIDKNGEYDYELIDECWEFIKLAAEYDGEDGTMDKLKNKVRRSI